MEKGERGNFRSKDLCCVRTLLPVLLLAAHTVWCVSDRLNTILKAVVLGLTSHSSNGGFSTPDEKGSRSGTATPNTFASAGSGMASPPPQLQYNMGLAFWIATYDQNIAAGLNA